MSWDIEKEKLLCHMVLDDRLAPLLSVKAGDAFWRAFIVKNRETGHIKAKLRWNYKDKGRSWTEIDLKEQNDEVFKKLHSGLEKCMVESTSRFLSPELAKEAIKSYYPPDDGGDGMKTVLWLQEQDLLGPVRIEDVDMKGKPV